MSRRLLERGRYPRAPGVDQLTNNSTQFSQVQGPVTSEVPYYPPIPSQQPSDPWNWKVENNPDSSSYPNFHSQHQQPGSNHQQHHQLSDSNYQQQQQPGSEYQYAQPSNYNYPQQQKQVDPIYQQPLQPDSSYQQQQQRDPNYHQQKLIDPNCQQQPHQPDPNYQQPHQPDPNYQQPHQPDPNYQQLQHQPDPNYQQHQLPDPNYQQKSVSNNQQPVAHTESWSQIQQSPVENQNYIQQPMAFIPNPQQNYEPPVDSQLINNNSNNSALDASLQSWENGTLSITQPAELPWTYSSPQYCNSTTNSSDFPSNSVPSTVPLNFSSVNAYEPETSDTSVSNYLPNDNSIINGAVDIPSSVSQSIENECEDDTDSSNVPDCDTASINRDLIVDAEYAGSSLSAFFQNSQQNSCNNSEYGGISTPDVKNVLDSSSLDENLAQLQINESEKNSVPTEDEQDDQNLEDTDDGGNQEINYFQKENIHLDVEDEKVDDSYSPVGYVEEPVNQEVPEPSTDESKNSPPQLAQVNQDYHEMSPEEPFNQQIPAQSGDKSRSTSSERERVVIRPREESPFKPPRVNNNSKGTVVQQEIPVQNIKENKHTEEKTVVQEVNLETFPDNLERPPDYEELRKQSSFYVSHQKHLRTELNSSPSSLLCDNPDIPCVTLAPAAPPIHSSAKSDKSESSSDSRREMTSYDKAAVLKSNIKECNNLPVLVDSELSEQSMSSGRSYPYSVKDPSEQKSTRSVNNIANTAALSIQPHQALSAQPLQVIGAQPQQVIGAEQPQAISSQPQQAISAQPQQVLSTQPQQQNILQQPPYPYLKDSKIKDIRNPDDYRKTELSMENLQTPNNGQGYSSSHSDYSSSRPRIDPRYSQHEAEYNRQKFVDKKYPSFDERQYYSDRERSRPPSRSSLDDRSEDYRYPHRPRNYPPNDDRRYGHPDHERPPSRMSESDMNRLDKHGQYDYYKQQYPYSGPYSKNQDYYQKPQQNYRGYEYDSYQRDPYASYYDAYRYAYSNYNYGFYDELYRNDPRYRQYREEQYRQYYAKYGYDVEYDRSSVQSGRSSGNDLTKDMTSNQYSEHDVSSNASEISAYNITQDYSYDDVPNEVSISGADHSSTPSARLTPVKFPYAHPIVRFSAGGILITAIPSQVDSALPAPVKIQNMQYIMENEDSYLELKNHQGPLIRGQAHKNDVVEFCNQRIKLLRKKDDVVDRDSYILLWELMILLLRQNGAVAGSDIAELLLKDHEVLGPHAISLRHILDTPQSEQSPAEVNDSSSQSHAGDTSSPDEGIVVLHDKSVLNASKTVNVDKVTQKFREFLLFGHKKDALEWAMKHALWGHALFLASKMDLRTYANVMTRFANSLALNDPLQTLYQLMSGRQPSAVTCVVDKKWGDWRPHLAMILSNPSTIPDVDSRSITTLGDTLASRGCLPAAHFCYIMAQVEFGTFEQKSSKLVLLSADHRLSFEEFATNEAIQCTEIYEYAQSLANPGYLLIHLQMYKFLYALRLVEHGFLEEALHYCEVIAGNLQTHPTLFSYDLIAEVFKLSSQLKYHDPHFLRGQGEYEDQDDPEWLKNLEFLVKNYNNILQGQNSQMQYEQPPDTAQTGNETINQQPAPTDNVSYQSMPQPSLQTDISNSVNNSNFYPQNNWNQQTTALPNATNSTNNQPEMHPYYQQHDMSNQNNAFQFESSVPSHEENETTDVPSSPVTQTPPFDYYSGSNQQVSDNKQTSYDQFTNYTTTATHRERRDSALSSGSKHSTSNLSVARKPPVKETAKPEPKKEAKPSSQAGKTWLGGIFSRLLPKAPNQMILPDDKNPTIVWDEVTKRWVNKDSNDEDESNAPLAPPTDTELMGSKSSDKPTVPPGSSMPPIATSPVNKFQRPKTRVMRQNYVDVLNNSGFTTKSSVPPEALFPTSFEQPATSNMFVPSSVQNVGENSPELDSTNSFNNSGLETEEQSQVVSAPLMFDPAEFDSRRSNMASQRHTIGRTGRRTYPT